MPPTPWPLPFPFPHPIEGIFHCCDLSWPSRTSLQWRANIGFLSEGLSGRPCYHILRSREPGCCCSSPPPWRPRNPKGQLTQLWKTVKILTLAINAYKLGNLSCFIKLSPGTRRHWRPLIEKKQKTNDWPCPFLIYQFLPEPFVLQASVTYRPSCLLL